MVTNDRLVRLLAAGVATLALAGCASSATRAGGSAATTDVSSAASSETPSPTSSTPTPHSSNPFLACDGISGLDVATTLVDDGRTVLVVTAQISEQPTHEAELTNVVPLQSYSVQAGDETNGPVKEVQFEAAPGANLLPAGTYLLLLGATPTSSRYFLSNGLPGSFEQDGDNAYQRCPNYSDPSQPRTIQTGVTDVAQLADLFNQAIQTVNASSSSEPSSGSGVPS